MYAQCCTAQGCIRVARVSLCHSCHDLGLVARQLQAAVLGPRPWLLLAEEMYTVLCMCKQGCNSHLPAMSICLLLVYHTCYSMGIEGEGTAVCWG
jgi:hypothetical protein